MEGVRVPCIFCNRKFLSKGNTKTPLSGHLQNNQINPHFVDPFLRFVFRSNFRSEYKNLFKLLIKFF